MKSNRLIKRIRAAAAAKERKRINTDKAIRFIHSFKLQSVSLLADGRYGVSISSVETKIVD